jgi:hopanoid biosynthesis associated radical SAM protein HpnJ
MRKTLFLNPPSYEGFDGGAGSRYQAKREVRSFYYPTWLAQPAALVPGSRLIDAPARGMTLEDVLPQAPDFELAVLHTSTPSFARDVKVAEALRETNPALTIGLVGAHVSVNRDQAIGASKAIDFIATDEFDFTVREIAEGRPFEEVAGLSYRNNGDIRHTGPRPVLEDMDRLPHVVDVYKRDLVIEDYYNGYLHHPYVSFYTGRGCQSRCTFCLWPQTISGHRYRTRSTEHVLEEMAKAKEYFPQAKEFFFDDDTFTDNLPRAEEIARGLGEMGITWSCNAKGNVPESSLRVLKENGLRQFVVGYETGNQEILNGIKKGMRTDWAMRFSEDCHKLGIKIHGCFIVGLPGETQQTIRETMEFAKQVNPQTIQVSVAAAYPGTYLHDQAQKNGWLLEHSDEQLVSEAGTQISSIEYPHLSHDEIFAAAGEFYKKFYFRPRKMLELAGGMLTSAHELKRRLREGVEFARFLRSRKDRS